MNSWSLLLLSVEGVAPENIVFRLKRSGIPLYYLKKTKKNVLELCIERKYRKKAFTILEGSCYNIRSVRNYGLARLPDYCKRKAGLGAGALLFCVLCALSGLPVLRVDVEGDVPTETICAILAERGVGVGKLYPDDLTPELTATILALQNVTFCSVQKTGSVLKIKVRTEVVLPSAERGKNLYARYAGVVESLVVLRGRAAAEVGTEVEAGALLAAGDEDEIVMAKARLRCRVVTDVAADTAEQAYAAGILAAGADGEIVAVEVVPGGEGRFRVTTEFLVYESINM